MYIIYNFINFPGSSLLATDKFIESVLQLFASNSSTTVWYASSGKLLSLLKCPRIAVFKLLFFN